MEVEEVGFEEVGEESEISGAGAVDLKVIGRRVSKCLRALGRQWRFLERCIVLDAVSEKPSSHRFDAPCSRIRSRRGPWLRRAAGRYMTTW